VTEVRWTQQAADDLAAVRDFIARDSAVYAQLVVERLYSAVGQLRDFPDSGRVVPERAQPHLRELIRPPFRIVYQRHPEIVEILAIVRSSRLFPLDVR
jgi:plasmid stabilization system protein ParE